MEIVQPRLFHCIASKLVLKIVTVLITDHVAILYYKTESGQPLTVHLFIFYPVSQSLPQLLDFSAEFMGLRLIAFSHIHHAWFTAYVTPPELVPRLSACRVRHHEP